MAKEKIAFERLDFNSASKIVGEKGKIATKDREWRKKIDESKTIENNLALVNQGLAILNQYTDDVVGVTQDYREISASLSEINRALEHDNRIQDNSLNRRLPT